MFTLILIGNTLPRIAYTRIGRESVKRNKLKICVLDRVDHNLLITDNRAYTIKGDGLNSGWFEDQYLEEIDLRKATEINHNYLS